MDIAGFVLKLLHNFVRQNMEDDHSKIQNKITI